MRLTLTAFGLTVLDIAFLEPEDESDSPRAVSSASADAERSWDRRPADPVFDASDGRHGYGGEDRRVGFTR